MKLEINREIKIGTSEIIDIEFDEIMELVRENLCMDEQLKLIRELKELIYQNIYSFDEIFDYIDTLSYEEQQNLIKRLVERYPSIEKCQELHKNLVAHNAGKDEQ